MHAGPAPSPRRVAPENRSGRYNLTLSISTFAHSKADADFLARMLRDRLDALCGRGQTTCTVVSTEYKP